jgi:heterodisulfide reductase subunit A-like polyferredoxin
MYEKKGRYIVEFPDIPSARQHQTEISVEERRGSNKEVELGFDEERARREAKRCLSCRRCLGCALCWAECKPEAIIFEMEDEEFELDADSIIVSQGVERAYDRVDRRFGLGQHLNVIADVHLEQMLRETGPSRGLVIRPYDGEIPARIAFVQGYEAAPPAMHKAALCLGINEAILVRSKLPTAEIQVLARDLAAFRMDHESALKALERIDLHEGSVTAVVAEENQSLRLTIVRGGTEESRTFDLVVLLTQPQLSRELRQLIRALGVSVSSASFLPAGEGSVLVSTDKANLRLAAQV